MSAASEFDTIPLPPGAAAPATLAALQRTPPVVAHPHHHHHHPPFTASSFFFLLFHIFSQKNRHNNWKYTCVIISQGEIISTRLSPGSGQN
jgi:hypothetical protein